MNDIEQKILAASQAQDPQEFLAGVIDAAAASWAQELEKAVQMALAVAANPTAKRVRLFREQVRSLEALRRQVQEAGGKLKVDAATVAFLRHAHEYAHGQLDRLQLFRRTRDYVATRHRNAETG